MEAMVQERAEQAGATPEDRTLQGAGATIVDMQRARRQRAAEAAAAVSSVMTEKELERRYEENPDHNPLPHDHLAAYNGMGA